MLEAAGAGRHALLVAATGAGKTLAGFLPTLAELVENMRSPAQAGVQTLPTGTSVGAGSQPEIAAVRVWPTTAEPVMVGAGEETKGRPAVTAVVAIDVLVVDTYPFLVPVA